MMMLPQVAMGAVLIPFVTPALRRHCLPFVPATDMQIKNVLEAVRQHGYLAPLKPNGWSHAIIIVEVFLRCAVLQLRTTMINKSGQHRM
jgi:hypothetical protein